jgi:hypothetical protein
MAYAVCGVELGTMVYPKNPDGTAAGEPYDDGQPAGGGGAGAGGANLDAMIARLTQSVATGGGAAAMAMLQQLLGQRQQQQQAAPPSAMSSYIVPVAIIGVAAVAGIALLKNKKKA